MTNVTIIYTGAGKHPGPSCLPIDKGFIWSTYFGFETLDERATFMAHHNTTNRNPRDLDTSSLEAFKASLAKPLPQNFDTHEHGGFFWCVWRSGCNGPGEGSAVKLGYTIHRMPS